MPKDEISKQWMEDVDMEHLSTWMGCAGTSTLESDMTAHERRRLLAASLDLPPQFGGLGLQSLIRVANEEWLGSWASVTTNLIAFFRSKGLTVYDKLADALDAMADENIDLATPIIPTYASLLTAALTPEPMSSSRASHRQKWTSVLQRFWGKDV